MDVYETSLKNKVNKELLKLIETKETYTVFTSPSAFDSFVQFYNPKYTKIISIGKTTTDYVNSKGFDCMLTSKMQSYEGISESLIKYFHQKWNFQQIDWEDSDIIKFWGTWLKM